MRAINGLAEPAMRCLAAKLKFRHFKFHITAAKLALAFCNHG